MSVSLEFVITQLIQEPKLHASWLNTFSYLEYIGFRKIIKSQRSDAITAEILEHANEEGRHALRLKKMAIKIGGDAFDSYRPTVLLCPREANAYFSELDSSCEIRLADEKDQRRKSKLAYQYVTCLVEQRALSVYSTYQKMLSDLGRRLPLGGLFGLLAEELRHLEKVHNSLRCHDPDFALRMRDLKKVETRLYHNFLNAVSQTLEATNGEFDVVSL